MVSMLAKIKELARSTITRLSVVFIVTLVAVLSGKTICGKTICGKPICGKTICGKTI